MKLNVWLLTALAPVITFSASAQTNGAIIAPSPTATTTNSAPAKPHKAKSKHTKSTTKTTKTTTKASASALKSEMLLDPPVQATVKCDNLDVRGQGSFAGEVIGHIKKGEMVTVLAELTLGHTHGGEPGAWSRIALPASMPVWVDGDFIDSSSKTVRVHKVNLRGGPGENYSVLGTLEKGAPITELRKKGTWIQIEAATNAAAFVASEYLDKQPSSGALASTGGGQSGQLDQAQPVVTKAPEAPIPVASTNHEAPPVESTPVAVQTPTPMAPAPAASSSDTEQELRALRRASTAEPMADSSARSPMSTPMDATKMQTPREVTREGVVKRAYNIQAPEAYELHDLQSGFLIEYLQPPQGQSFKALLGASVHITGTEFLDPMWPRTPILHVQTVAKMH